MSKNILLPGFREPPVDEDFGDEEKNSGNPEAHGHNAWFDDAVRKGVGC